MNIDGSVVAITGASGGIGEAVARDLAAAGAKLVLTARGEDKLKALADELGAAHLAGEATDPALPQRLLDLALERHGRADALFNNAGVMHVGTVDEIDVDKACAMARVNFEAVIRFAYIFLRQFKRQGAGFLLNTSSVAGVQVRPGTGPYSGSKHAVEAMTDALALELLGTGVHVAVIEPGTVATGLYRDWDKSKKDWVDSEGVLAPEDIARAVRFMLEQPLHVRVGRMLVLPSGARPE